MATSHAPLSPASSLADASSPAMAPARAPQLPFQRQGDTAPLQPPQPGRGAGDAGRHSAVGQQPAGTQPAAALSDEVAVMVLADVQPAWRLWGWWRIARGAQALRHTAGLIFGKVMGSGFEGGFGLRPSASRQGVFLVFATEAAADDFLREAPLLRHYRQRTRELCTLKLRPWSARGHWSGHDVHPSAQAPDPAEGGIPVVALTRASIHWQRAKAFWAKAPPAQHDLANAPGCLLAVGLGEAPLLRQCTFSLWDSVAAMDAYARSGAHLAAIRASSREGYFSESMFLRCVPVAMQGCWKGTVYG